MAETTNEYVEEEGSLPEGLMKQILSLALKWGDKIDMKTFKMIHLSAGSTANKNYRVTWPANGSENVVTTVLVRIYGQSLDFFLSRDQEIKNFVSISDLGLGPKLLGQFPEGRIEEFILARTLSAGDLRDPEISALIAAKMREFHNLDIPGSKKVILWDVLRKLFNKARSTCTPEHANEFRLDIIEEEIGLLETELSQGNDQDIGFCHNDLQYANIMIDEQTRKITFIDYEYASYGPIAHDFATYFCEMAANYHSDTPHILNYSMYPNLEERQRLIRLYLNSAGHHSSEAEVEKVVNDAEMYTLVNHLTSGLFGIISSYVNDIEFDYIAYAKQRFEQYWLKKPLLLGTTTAIPVAPKKKQPSPLSSIMFDVFASLLAPR